MPRYLLQGAAVEEAVPMTPEDFADAIRAAVRAERRPRIASQLPEVVADVVSMAMLLYLLAWAVTIFGVPLVAFVRWYVRLWGLW